MQSGIYGLLEVRSEKIAIIGDYNQNEESHCLIMESIKEVAEEIHGELKAQWIMSDALDVSEEH